MSASRLGPFASVGACGGVSLGAFVLAGTAARPGAGVWGPGPGAAFGPGAAGWVVGLGFFVLPCGLNSACAACAENISKATGQNRVEARLLTVNTVRGARGARQPA